MNPATLQYQHQELWRRLPSAESTIASTAAAVSALESRVVALESADGGVQQGAIDAILARLQVLESLLLNVPYDRLLGRYSTTTGPAQFVQIGTGLDLSGDTLVNTGGGGSGRAFSSAFSSAFS